MLAIFLGLLSGCVDVSNTIRPRQDSDFFPLKVGNYLLYDVTETHYSFPEKKEEFAFQLKHEITSSFIGSTGLTHYVIERYKTDGITNLFTYLDTWSVRVEPSRIVLNQENVSYVILSFPLTSGKRWDGNAFNTLGGEDTCGNRFHLTCDAYEVGRHNVPYTYKEKQLNETVEIIQQDNPDPIVKYDVRREIYARHIGLIYQESTIFEYCTVGDCVGKQQIEKGITRRQQIRDYGYKE